jgi:hypothetical protein
MVNQKMFVIPLPDYLDYSARELWWMVVLCWGFAALTGYISPLSLALSREGRGDVLFEDTQSIQLGCTNKLSAYLHLLSMLSLSPRGRGPGRGQTSLFKAHSTTKNSTLKLIIA